MKPQQSKRKRPKLVKKKQLNKILISLQKQKLNENRIGNDKNDS